jgi:hypothetical protein
MAPTRTPSSVKKEAHDFASPRLQASANAWVSAMMASSSVFTVISPGVDVDVMAW